MSNFASHGKVSCCMMENNRLKKLTLDSLALPIGLIEFLPSPSSRLWEEPQLWEIVQRY